MRFLRRPSPARLCPPPPRGSFEIPTSRPPTSPSRSARARPASWPRPPSIPDFTKLERRRNGSPAPRIASASRIGGLALALAWPVRTYHEASGRGAAAQCLSTPRVAACVATSISCRRCACELRRRSAAVLGIAVGSVSTWQRPLRRTRGAPPSEAHGPVLDVRSPMGASSARPTRRDRATSPVVSSTLPTVHGTTANRPAFPVRPARGG